MRREPVGGGASGGDPDGYTHTFEIGGQKGEQYVEHIICGDDNVWLV